jgi:hypothetical protein
MWSKTYGLNIMFILYVNAPAYSENLAKSRTNIQHILMY